MYLYMNIYFIFQHSGRSLYQIDIVPTVSLLLGMPIPFSNLGMIIPEVFLPWQAGTTDDQFSVEASDGYGGRVTPEFLAALQVNADQLQRYLQTYVKHADDFPSNVYVSLQNRLARAQKLHEDVKSRLDSTKQAELTATASAYVEYMRDVKTMCHNVWAKFDNFYINQGIILFTLTVITTFLTLYDTNLSLTCLWRNLRVAIALGMPLSLISLIVSPLPLEMGVSSIVDVILALSFYPLTIFLVIHSLRLSYHLYQLLIGKSITAQIFSPLNQLSFTYIFSIIVAVGCSVSLLTNSFILYEGDMTVFFIQSILICFIVQRVQCVSEQCAVVPSSISECKEGTQRPKGHFAAYLKTSWPLLLAMVLVRLSKLFHACRDLQVGCEPTSFVQPFHGAVEILGNLAGIRLFVSCLGVVCIPLALATFVRYSGKSHRLSRCLLLCIYAGLPLSSLCVSSFWIFQSLPQPTLDSLPHWQHVVLPRTVYAICSATIAVCITAPFRKRQNKSQNSVTNVGDNINRVQNEGRRKLSSGNIRQRVVVATDISTHDSDSKKDKVGNNSSVPASFVVVFVLLLAVWLPAAMVLNDGIALSAILMTLQLPLIILALSHSQGTYIYMFSRNCTVEH